MRSLRGIMVGLLWLAPGLAYSADFVSNSTVVGYAEPQTADAVDAGTTAVAVDPSFGDPTCGSPGCGEASCGAPGCGSGFLGGGCGALYGCNGCGSGGCGLGGCALGGLNLLKGNWFGGCGTADDGCSNGLKLRGWVDTGGIFNTQSPASHYNGPYNAVDRSNRGMFNQAYFIAEKGLPTCGTGIGGRVDLLYGEDYLLAQSIGMELRPNGANHWNPASQTIGLAIPQAYLELGSQRLSVKLGHFYSIVGYEGVQAPTNFFYSKSYSYQFAGPFTHWGGLATFKPNANWQFQVGLTNGWNGLDRTSDQMGVLAGAKYTGNCWWSSFAITTGQDPNNVAGLPGVTPAFTNRTRYSYLLGLTLTDRLSYVFHQWLGVQGNALPNGGQAQWYGIDQYLTYRINSCWASALRFEWFRDDDGTRIGLNRAQNLNNPPYVGSAYSLSAGLNWTPSKQLLVRPEIRSDWFVDQNGRVPYNDSTRSNQLMLGMDAIYQF